MGDTGHDSVLITSKAFVQQHLAEAYSLAGSIQQPILGTVLASARQISLLV
jgi:hypothetical protein